jgi:hypothetical protein
MIMYVLFALNLIVNCSSFISIILHLTDWDNFLAGSVTPSYYHDAGPLECAIQNTSLKVASTLNHPRTRKTGSASRLRCTSDSAIEACPAKPLALQHFRAIDLAFDRPLTPRQRYRRLDGSNVLR